MKKKYIPFTLDSSLNPKGDQPTAITKLMSCRPGLSTLLGVTGSGKTFTIANIIQQTQKPTLILSPNKTLAAQLYEEFSAFFPHNKVCYFVSFYDYYRPESYMPKNDTYIPKHTRTNMEIERLRVETVASTVSRNDVIIIASVSCIYGLGNPEEYKKASLVFAVNEKINKQEIIKKLNSVEYYNNSENQEYGTFTINNNYIDVILPYQRDILRIIIDNDSILALTYLTREAKKFVSDLEEVVIFPARYFINSEAKKESAVKSIVKELEEAMSHMTDQKYRERLYNRVMRDVQLIQDTGTCPGIENYSAHFDARQSDEKPFTLLDFCKDFLIVIDESHIAIPQLRGMYAGDRARKKNLVDHGFRLPSALDNRPLKFNEIEGYFHDVIFVSATPGDYELQKSSCLAEQLIRPTGIIDPEITILSRKGQLKILLDNIKKTTAQGGRTLVNVLTKILAEELAEYLEKAGISVCYVHHSIKTTKRSEILHKLREGTFDCLIGINLLREGLDLPEVSLVVIMDADIESFLRDKRSLIQIIGRAARNAHAQVLLFADGITKSMREALDETERRRNIQKEYNEAHNITPHSTTRSVTKSITPGAVSNPNSEHNQNKKMSRQKSDQPYESTTILSKADEKSIKKIEKEMVKAADIGDFDKAIQLKKIWLELKQKKGS